MKKIVLVFVVGVSMLITTGCGFHLRGYESPVLANSFVVLSVENEQANRNLIKQTTLKLAVLGASVESHYNRLNTYSQPDDSPDQTSRQPITIRVTNVELRKIEPIGTLREVQLILAADVAFESQGKTKFTRRLRVQRSYQFDAATVNTQNQQETIIIDRLNNELAERIARQLSLYKQPKHQDT